MVATALKRLAASAVIVAALALLPACGGGDDGDSENAPPTSVSAADLDKNGDFWLSLTPDLKDELIDLGKSRLGEERPDGAASIQAMPTAGLVAEVDKEYANAAKRAVAIYETYTTANDKIAKAKFDEAIGGLDELCNGPEPPPECG